MAKKRKVRSAANFKRIRVRQSLVGPPPVLHEEDPAPYQLWLTRLYADVEPRDLAEEAFVHDIADADWQVRCWRRIRTCIVDAAMPTAIIWVLGMPGDVALRYIRGFEDIDFKRYPNRKPSEEVKESKALMKAQISRLQEGKCPLIPDTIMARAHLYEFE